MQEFRFPLSLGNMVFMVSRLNKIFGKSFEVWNQKLKVLDCGWIIGFEKLKEDDGMS